MKYKFEEKDIELGTFVIKNSSPKGSGDLGFASTVAYKICWIPEGKINTYCMVAMFTDGGIFKLGTKDELLQHINEDKHGYRPLTKQELLNILSHSNNGFLNY